MSERLLREKAASAETFETDGDEAFTTIRSRSSGVRATALPVLEEDALSEAPTLFPRVVARTASEVLAPIHELLYRFDVGDHRGALATAEALLDRSLVPSIAVPVDLLASFAIDTSGAILLSAIDGRASLETVLEQSTLPLLDALRALCDLLDARIVVLR